MASMAKKVSHAGVMFQPCRNHIECDYWSITVYAFIHQTCMATSWQKAKKATSFCCTPSHICSKCLRASLPCPCMAHPPSMAFQVTTSWDAILLITLQASSMLPHFAYMSTKLFSTMTSDSQPLWMICSWAHLASSRATMWCMHSALPRS